VKADGSSIQGQPALHSETPSQGKNKQQKNLTKPPKKTTTKTYILVSALMKTIFKDLITKEKNN
jgi:hypothetical protein